MLPQINDKCGKIIPYHRGPNPIQHLSTDAAMQWDICCILWWEGTVLFVPLPQRCLVAALGLEIWLPQALGPISDCWRRTVSLQTESWNFKEKDILANFPPDMLVLYIFLGKHSVMPSFPWNLKWYCLSTVLITSHAACVNKANIWNLFFIYSAQGKLTGHFVPE